MHVIDSTTNLPKGWFKWGYYELGADKIESNNFVGTVTSVKKGDKFGIIGLRIPANYVGDSITLSGYMKIENVKKGSAGLIMRIDGFGKNQMISFDNMSKENISGTKDWQKHSITLPLSERAKTINVGGFLSGKGKAWFDKFVVTIDGQDIQKLKEVEKLTLEKSDENEVKNTILQHIKVLDLASEHALENSLTPLIESIGNKKIISIGEDTHGTSEFYKLRFAITKKLIEEKGFTTVILENPYDDIELLTSNLEHESIDSLMKKHLFSIYQTKEMKVFLEWFKANRTTRNIKFQGCDDSFRVMPLLLKREFSEIKDEKVNSLLALYKDRATLNLKQYRKKYSKDKVKPKSENDLGQSTYEVIVALEKDLKLKNLLTSRRQELIFNAKNTYINYLHLANSKRIQSRDEIMADRISYIAQNSEEKIIVWAHNAHISNSVIIDNEIGIMGYDLKKEFGNDYHAIGMSSLNGSYSYIENKFINDDPYV